MDEKKHQGQMLQEAIKNSGYTIVAVAARMGMSRNTIYGRFKHRVVNPYFLFRIGRIINHDFTRDLPELTTSEVYCQALANAETPEQRHNRLVAEMQLKYYRILEDYNRLLKFLVRIINDNELYALKKEVTVFVQHNFNDKYDDD